MYFHFVTQFLIIGDFLLLVHTKRDKTVTSGFGFAFREMLLECEEYMTEQEEGGYSLLF